MIFLHVRLQLTYLHPWICTCLGWDEAQDPGFCLIRSRLRDILVYHDYMHDSFDWMDVTIPESICWSLLLDGYVHTSDLSSYIYFIMDGCAHATCSCIRDISCICNCRSSDSGVWFECVLVKHFTHSSLGPHALGGICYIAFFHCPAIPIPHIGGSFLWPK